MNILLVINAGSSSLKYEVFDMKNLQSLFEGKFEEIGSAGNAHAKAVKKVAQRLQDFTVSAIGHRVVHGGGKYSMPVLITKKVIQDIKRFALLAPLHNPANLAGILACRRLFPQVPQIACFDTAFYATMPEKAYRYAIPTFLLKKYGIRRYGFHGLSHAYVSRIARQKLGTSQTKRMITCHLGAGCSITAIKDGKAVDTTMGFTPLEGVPMGTRSGDIDPSIIFYLLRRGWPAKKIEHLLNYESGLKGISGISSDVRTLLKKKSRFARLALEVFCYRIAKAINGLTAVLGGLDCLVFTGGIGEHSKKIRRMILSYFPRKTFKVLIIPTDEEKHIAHLVARQGLKKMVK